MFWLMLENPWSKSRGKVQSGSKGQVAIFLPQVRLPAGNSVEGIRVGGTWRSVKKRTKAQFAGSPLSGVEPGVSLAKRDPPNQIWDSRAVNDADVLQDLIGQLGAHESGKKGSKAGSGTTHLQALRSSLASQGHNILQENCVQEFGALICS
ncbi:hypothetical protein VULLAG_LOCUS5865 [Vulpes lagopus]